MKFKESLSLALKRPPVLMALILATILVTLHFPGMLSTWSPMGASFAFDQFTLPRCGLAIRFGTNPFTSSADYPQYGYFATNWASHPLLCVVAGVPLSYLPPQLELYFTTLIYWLLHVWIIISFGARLSPKQTNAHRFAWSIWPLRDYLTFAALGFFFPYYVLYVLGQYHAIVVFALAAILLSEKNLILGFTLSAIGKPVLAPAALALLAAKKWGVIWKLAAISAFCYLPWLFLRYDVSRGLYFGINETFIKFMEISSQYTRYSVVGWSQEMGWSKVFDEFASPRDHFYLRIFLALIPIVLSIVLATRQKLQLAIGVAMLWFFMMYGRGHEYHYTLYLPLLIFLYCREDGRYRNWWMCGIALLTALPTVFPFFMHLYGFANHGAATLEAMKNANTTLYWLFLLHKPLLAPLLLAQILWCEIIRPQRNESKLF